MKDSLGMEEGFPCFVENLLSGALCGMTVDSIIFPLDTIKT